MLWTHWGDETPCLVSGESCTPQSAPHTQHTPPSVHCNCVQLAPGSFHVCSALCYWKGIGHFGVLLFLSCSHLWSQHHVVYSAEHIKLGVFPFSWDLMFGFGRKWRETKSSNPLRTQDFKKKAWQCLGPSSCSQPSAQATHIYSGLDARSGLAKWLAYSEIMQVSPRITASCLGMWWEPGGRNASGVGHAWDRHWGLFVKQQ